MMYETMFARSFSRNEQKKLRYGAFIGFLVIALSFCTVFKPYLTLQPVSSNLRVSAGEGLRLLRIVGPESFRMPRMSDTATSSFISMNQTSNSKIQTSVDVTTIRSNTMFNSTSQLASNSSQDFEKGPSIGAQQVEPLICNFGTRSDYCELKGDIRISGKSSTVITVSSSAKPEAEIRPYARKTDEAAMEQVTRWSIKSTTNSEKIPQCTIYHSVPAVLFSSGGYAGNNFHDFTDIAIPLFMTSRPLKGQVKFLVTDRRFWWVDKFPKLLKDLSKYDLIDIDKEERIHCFNRMIVGLKRHPDELKIDPSLSSYSMKDFREYLRNCYSLRKATAIKIGGNDKRKRPRLLILARNGTRAFSNLEDVVREARILGFRVVVAEADSDVAKFARFANSCDVLMGVHGAGLANMVFLPENAVLIQVVPIGEMEWMAATFFGEPSKDMNIRYLEYRITAEESSLMEQFPTGHEVFRDPNAFKKRGWEAFSDVYMKQNVKLNVNRFRPTLLQALQLLHQ